MSVQRPPRYKLAVVVWLAIYPTVLVTTSVIGPLTRELPLALRTLVLTLIVIPIAVYVLIPWLNRVLANWLQPPTT